MKLHKAAVNADTVRAARRLADATKGDLYLAGGTALSLQIGHRISLDLDLFSEKATLDRVGREAILERLRSSGDLKILEAMDGTMHLRLEDTAVSLFRYRYRRVHASAGSWEGLTLAGPLDIAAMKLSAVVGRGARKDFIDLYFLGTKLGLPALFESAEAHFPDHPDFLLQAARALTYFDDAESEPMPRMLKDVTWETIRRYFEREAPRAVQRSIDMSR